MNWSKVREVNRRRSAKKVAREQRAAQRKAFVEQMGGPITLDEIRTATHRVEPPALSFLHDRNVWTFRGRDWVIGYSDGECIQAMAPFVAWRQDSDMRSLVPFTPAARKWFQAELCRLFPIED